VASCEERTHVQVCAVTWRQWKGLNGSAPHVMTCAWCCSLHAARSMQHGRMAAYYVSSPCIGARCELPELLLLRLAVVFPCAHGDSSCGCGGSACAEVALIKAAPAKY
jgi:hypothetical protein